MALRECPHDETRDPLMKRCVRCIDAILDARCPGPAVDWFRVAQEYEALLREAARYIIHYHPEAGDLRDRIDAALERK